MTHTEFVKKNLGKSLDFDNSYGNQCVDLFRFYVRDVLGYPQPLSVVGAKDFYANYDKDLSLKNCYQKILNTPEGVPQEGDVMIWDKWTGNPYGHIAILLNGSLNEFESLDQNWSNIKKVQKIKHNYLNPKVQGWFRPNKNMNFIDLKKRLTDTSWAELDEFSELEKLKLIERADSIQTMMIKWLKRIENEAVLKESDRQKGVKIEMLTESVEGLKSSLEALKTSSTAEVDLLLERHKKEIADLEEDADSDNKLIMELEIKNRTLELAIVEETKKRGSSIITIDFSKLINFLKTWKK